MTHRGLTLAGIGVAFGLLALWATREPGAAETPAASIFATPAALSGLDTERGIRQFEARVAEDPRDFISLTILGQLHIRRGRERADLASFDRAEQAFRRALALNPGHVPASLLLASAYASQHKFREALEIAQAVYDASPGNIDALATIADAYLETGRYTEGEKAVRMLGQKAGDVPSVLARRALVAELEGRTLDAVNLLQQAVTRMSRDADPAPDIAWYEARLGDIYFHRACLSESEQHFDAALRLHATYPIGLSGLAGVRAAQGRFEDAAGLYARAVAESPSPRRLFDLGAVEERLGRTEEALRHYQQAEEIARSAGANAAAYDRELSVFYAERVGRAAEALTLAERDLALRKDVKGYDTLAWALFRNQRYEEAAAAIGEAMKLGTRDLDFYYHAGMIYDALGQVDKAKSYLQKAAELTPQGRRECQLGN